MTPRAKKKTFASLDTLRTLCCSVWRVIRRLERLHNKGERQHGNILGSLSYSAPLLTLDTCPSVTAVDLKKVILHVLYVV